MFRAVLLDRDGVINEEVNLLNHPAQLRLVPGSAAAIAQLNRKGIHVVVITNQPVVARNLCSEADLQRIHGSLQHLLWESARARVDRIYYCPHHPSFALTNPNRRYLKECRCRKPGTGMVKDALRDFSLRPDECVMIGDSTRDILTGHRLRIPTVMLRTGFGGKDGQYDVRPNWVLPNLFLAIQYLFSGDRAELPMGDHGDGEFGTIRDGDTDQSRLREETP